MTTRYFVVYQDPSTAQLYEADTWSAVSFATPGERDRMIHDIQSANSAWSADAVRFFTVEQELLGYEGGSQDDDANAA